MKIESLKTTFVEKNAPYLGAQKLNDYWTTIENILNALATMPIDKGSFNATGSTSSNYNLTSYRLTAPDASELPLAFVIVPTITSAAGLTITPSWGATAYQVWDASSNTQVLASAVKASQPTQFLFDGTKFWVVGGSAYLQLSSTANSAGYFDKGSTAPTGTTRLNYSGYMYSTRFYGAVFNESASDFAEGFNVDGSPEAGTLIKINPDGTYAVNDIPMNTKIIGIVSSPEQYGMLLGTQYGETPIAMCGRIKAKVSGYICAGDDLVAAYESGFLMSAPDICDHRSICAVALESNGDEYGEILVLVKRG